MNCLALLLLVAGTSTGQTPVKTAREALQPFGELVGSWRGTGTPTGTREEQQKNFWQETIACEWKFKGADAWLVFAFDKSKHFTKAELRYSAEKSAYLFKAETVDKKQVAFEGTLQGRNLTLETADSDTRLVFTLLHYNRFLYRQETRPAGKTLYAKTYQVGATKEGVAFAVGSGKPECIVSGGLGATAVLFQGKTYYVCCGGCRTEFYEDPMKYILEAEAKAKKK